MKWRLSLYEGEFMKKQVLAILLASTMLCACGEKGYENQHDLSAGTSKEDVISEMDKKPKEENSTSNTETASYDDEEYCGHKGTMTYYFSQKKLTLTQWDTTAKDEKECQDIYNDIKDKLNQKYGNGNSNGDENNYSWITEEKQVTLSCDLTTFQVKAVEFNTAS